MPLAEQGKRDLYGTSLRIIAINDLGHLQEQSAILPCTEPLNVQAREDGMPVTRQGLNNRSDSHFWTIAVAMSPPQSR
jgi:hypothetical protein